MCPCVKALDEKRGAIASAALGITEVVIEGGTDGGEVAMWLALMYVHEPTDAGRHTIRVSLRDGSGKVLPVTDRRTGTTGILEVEVKVPPSSGAFVEAVSFPQLTLAVGDYEWHASLDGKFEASWPLCVRPERPGEVAEMRAEARRRREGPQ
jgi:hypothetical protein